MLNNLKNNNNGLLTKQQYLQLNRVAFQNLNTKDKDARYQLYVRKYQRKNQSLAVAKLPKQITLPVRNNRNVNNNNNKINGNGLKLSKCLLAYAQASIDPFSNITELPCIPDTLVVPSNKYRTYLEADVVVGTEGVGWAVMSPWKMLANNNGTNNTTYSDYPVVTTGVTYDGAQYNWGAIDFTTSNVIGWNPQSIIDLAQTQAFDNSMSWRLVAAGMELDYTGVLLNQAGLITVLQFDGLNDIARPISMGVLRQHPRSQTCPTSREARCYVRYEPVNTSNFSYLRGIEYYPEDRTYYYPLGIFISGAEPGTTFRIRAVAYFEIQTSNLPATPSEADPIGFPAFQAARSTVLPTADPKSDLLSILKKTASNILTSISGFGPTIGTAIGSLVGQPIIGGMIGGISKDLINSIFG